MRLSTLIPLLGLAASPLLASAESVADYFSSLAPTTRSVLLNNVTGAGAGADPGIVAAVIPNASHPDFSIYWLRDACLVYNVWLNELVVLGDKSLRPLMDDVTLALVRSQHVESLSGSIFNGGLEEPVFYLNLSFIRNASYRPGSPAADGPPFRAAMLIKYADWLLEPAQNNGTWVADNLWPAINLDLQWISRTWNQSSYDLWWPPVWGGSYWTAALQYRALIAGARLGHKIGRHDTVVDYPKKAALVLEYMQSFWNPVEGFMSETTITDVALGRSGVGSAALTASVYNYDQNLGCDPLTFQPCSDRALSALKVVGDKFKAMFPLTQNIPADKPGWFGFFTEDEFIGGQPQFFSTFNAAEQLYAALTTWDKIGSLSITPVSLKFFVQFDKNAKVGTYSSGSKTYSQLTVAIRSYADEIIAMTAKGTPPDFILTESVDKVTGEPFGPPGMIRSLAAALGVVDTYMGMPPPSWSFPKKRAAGTDGLQDVDSQFYFDSY
ncbi:glycoside hydrolase family 15 protein [Auriscalpium vulgare]|uniref:Glycoside hydrolase family 15 protein n=1 Tax=Auriscalpium vulgare TaxID=40419 RepID=A0ACB8RBN8_9AGAM|nr:glycoside hydrolase family 15 protein [Auriscalpium vulgare]